MSQIVVPEAPAVGRGAAGVLATTRAGEWWVYKLAPILATFYATASLRGQPLLPRLGPLLGLLLALVVGAVYVSVLNDWTDRCDDAAAGKTNRLAGKSALFIGLALGMCVGVGSGCGWYFWQRSPLGAGLYGGSWVAYSLYSLPPLRLKERGLAGVLADAAGAHLFPQLLTVAVASQGVGRAVPLGWWAAVGTWALACGLRNILWHQLGDASADAQAGVDTFVVRRGGPAVQRLGRVVVFPIEVVAFGILLVMSQQGWAMGLLGLYAGLEWCRWRIWEHRPVVLAPHSRLVLNDYYQFFYPLALLLAQSLRYPPDGLVLGLHLLLFGRYTWQFAQEARVYAAVLVRRVGS